MDKNWKKLSSKIVYQNPWIKIREDQVIRPDQQEGIYGYLDKRPAVIIIPIDQDNNLYLIRQFRYPIQQEILEFPAGIMDNDNILEQAKKELHEETGLSSEHWEHLGDYYLAPGHENSLIHVLLARQVNLKNLDINHQEADEAISSVMKVSINELYQLISDNKITCGPSLAAFSLLLSKKIIN